MVNVDFVNCNSYVCSNSDSFLSFHPFYIWGAAGRPEKWSVHNQDNAIKGELKNSYSGLVNMQQMPFYAIGQIYI